LVAHVFQPLHRANFLGRLGGVGLGLFGLGFACFLVGFFLTFGHAALSILGCWRTLCARGGAQVGLLGGEFAGLCAKVLAGVFPCRGDRRESLIDQCSQDPGVALAVVAGFAQRQPNVPFFVFRDQV